MVVEVFRQRPRPYLDSTAAARGQCFRTRPWSRLGMLPFLQIALVLIFVYFLGKLVEWFQEWRTRRGWRRRRRNGGDSVHTADTTCDDTAPDDTTSGDTTSDDAPD
jgi:hypothetical protein